MVFKLSEQLETVGDPNLPFKMYDSYLEHNKRKFPDSVLELIGSDRWRGGSDSESPYYAVLQTVHLAFDPVAEQTNAELVLWKGDYLENPASIHLNYIDVTELDISDKALTKRRWRYDEFLYSENKKPSHLDTKRFTHKIEWVQGSIWSITAADIEVEWNEV